MKKRMLTATLCAGLTATPLLAIFGIGDIVFDPTSYGELVTQMTQMVKEYNQLVTTYNMISNQYNQMVTNARFLTSKGRWQARLSAWKFPTATNTYGTTGGWVGAVNTGAAALNGYLNSVTQLKTYSPVWGTIPFAQQDHISRNYATVELSDGATVNALSQLGTIRGNSNATESAIDTLESESLSDDPTENTEVGVLNKINATTMISVRNTQDTTKLLAAALDHQMVEAKERRDAQVQSINCDVALRQQAPVAAAQAFTGTTAVLSTYRIP